MTTLGWIGVWLLAAAALAIVVEGALMVIWAAAMGKHARVLAGRVETDRELMESDLEQLRRSIVEMERLWQPYRRILLWLGHPLVIALFRSYRRRVAAR